MTDADYAVEINKKLIGTKMLWIKNNSTVTIKDVKDSETFVAEDWNGKLKEISIFDLRAI